jgi:glycosyltransferase involved in cell wall biosynthesis
VKNLYRAILSSNIEIVREKMCENFEPVARNFPKKTSVLFLGYAIDPNSGSESGGGWALLRTYLDLGLHAYILCGLGAEDSIKEELKSYNGQFEIVQKRKLDFLYNLLDLLPYSLQLKSLIWNLDILIEWKSLSAQYEFTFVHYATFAGDWNFCAPLYRRKIPLLWGPIGGTQKVPMRLFGSLGFMGIISESFRAMATSPFRFLNRLLVKKRSNIKILCLNDSVQKYFASSRHINPLVTNVVLPCLSESMKWRDKSSKYYFAAGRLIPLKNWGLAIKSLALIGEDSFLLIAGTGTYEKALRKLARSLSIENRVVFLGQISHSDCIELMLGSRGVVFPSLRDSASWFLAEAAHYGVPIITLNTPGSRSIAYFSKFDLVPIGKTTLVEQFSEFMKNPPMPLRSGQFCKCKMQELILGQIPIYT